jgi:hypothetical protein
MTRSLHVHSTRYRICGRLPSSLLPAEVLPGQIDTSAQKGFYRSPSFFVHGVSGVTKSRTTSASSVALARTSRAVMARALPSRIARSCLCDSAISLGHPLGKWTLECLTIVHSSRRLQSQECEAHHPHPRSGSKSWCASSGEHARRFPDRY